MSDLRDKYDFRVVPMPWVPHGASLRLLIEWARRIRAEGPDVVHIRGLQSEGLYGLVAARIAGCQATVLSVHGFYGDCTELGALKRALFNLAIEPLTLFLASSVYCVCHYAAQRQMVRRYARNLHGVIWNAAPRFSLVDREARRQTTRARLGIAQDALLVLAVGRLTYDKGYDLLLEAARELLRQDPRIELLVVGDGPYRARMVEALDSRRVHVVGSQQNVVDFYVAADIFVTTSRHENLSNALLEASETGLAIVATNVGGNPEVVVDRCTGTLVPPGDSVAVVDAILAYARNSLMRYDHGQAARARTRTHFAQESVFAQLDEVYCRASGRAEDG